MAAVLLAALLPLATSTAGEAVRHLSPEGAIERTATWARAERAGNTLYVAGMHDIDPETDTLVEGDEARLPHAFMNGKHIFDSAGGDLADTLRRVVYVTDMYRFRPLAHKRQNELWGDGPYPRRAIIEVDRPNRDDILEVEGTFYIAVWKPHKMAKKTGWTPPATRRFFR